MFSRTCCNGLTVQNEEFLTLLWAVETKKKKSPYRARAPPFSFPSLCQQAGRSLRGHKSGWKPQRPEAVAASRTAGRVTDENCGYHGFTENGEIRRWCSQDLKIQRWRVPKISCVFNVLVFASARNNNSMGLLYIHNHTWYIPGNVSKIHICPPLFMVKSHQRTIFWVLNFW